MLDSLLKEFNYPNLLKETKLTLVDIYEEKGDYLQANFHLKEYVKIVDSIKADELESKVNNLNLKYLLEKTNVKFDELKIKTNTQKIKIEYQKRIIIIAIILGIAILIFSLIILNFFIRLKKTNTKLSETSKELNKKNEELIELNSIHNNLFAIISHDLRGPIGTSTTLLNILNENSTELSTEERNKLMKTIGISVGSTFNLIENLLYWSKNRMRNLKTEKYRVYPYTIADMVITGINNTIFTKDIKIQNDILKEIEILTCEDILKIIFRNLLTNAIKFTSRNGMIRIWSETESNILKIHFTDNGEGMTKSTLSTIFDSKIIKSTQGTESEGGSGLGLMITSELTEQIGGALTAKSILGQGSTFTVTLPIEH
jgi:signal transduction histidine kinase